MTRVYDIRLEYSMRVICHGLVQTTQQAKIAADVREDEGTKYIGRCCRGGDSEQRYRFGRELLISRVRECVLQVASKDLVRKLQGLRSWFDTCKLGFTSACLPQREVGVSLWVSGNRRRARGDERPI